MAGAQGGRSGHCWKSLLESKGKVPREAGCGVCAINVDRAEKKGRPSSASLCPVKRGEDTQASIGVKARSAGFSVAQSIVGG